MILDEEVYPVAVLAVPVYLHRLATYPHRLVLEHGFNTRRAPPSGEGQLGTGGWRGVRLRRRHRGAAELAATFLLGNAPVAASLMANRIAVIPII